VHPPPLSAWANFTLMMECTPESSRCYSVYSVGHTGIDNQECPFSPFRRPRNRVSDKTIHFKNVRKEDKSGVVNTVVRMNQVQDITAIEFWAGRDMIQSCPN
jgi:hypothetical protein